MDKLFHPHFAVNLSMLVLKLNHICKSLGIDKQFIPHLLGMWLLSNGDPSNLRCDRACQDPGSHGLVFNDIKLNEDEYY